MERRARNTRIKKRAGELMRISQNSNVLISGASSGIGAELVRHYAGQGVTLGLMALDDELLDAMTKEAQSLGAKAVHVYPLDIRDKAAVRQAVSQFAEAAGSIDLWIASAGIDKDVSIDEFDSATIENIYDINVNGLIHSTNAVLEKMLQQGHGHIVGMASLAAYRVADIHADYSASKVAVDAYLESLRIRLQQSPIIITTVYPGFVRTPMTKNHTHPMPLSLSASQAAQKIINGIEKQKSWISFPWPLAMVMGLGRKLPYSLWKLILRMQ